MNYVMSDIHGYLDKFKQMLIKINFKETDNLYILGDCIDRGHESIELLLYIMKHENIHLIVGNHEEMMIESLLGNREYKRMWFNNGGNETYKEYNNLSREIQKQIYDYLCVLPLYIIVNNNILTHSGLNIPKYMRTKTIEEIIRFQERQDFLWNNENFYLNKGTLNYKIIFGHTPTFYINNKNLKKEKMAIWHDNIHKDKICIDCGIYIENGQLGCLCLDTLDEYYVN